MILNFPGSNIGTQKIKAFKVHKKFIGYYLIAELENVVQFYNSKTKHYENKRLLRIEGRGINTFLKFYDKVSSEVYLISIEENIILDIAEVTA